MSTLLVMGRGRPESDSLRVTQKPGKAMYTSNSRAPVADGRGIWEDPRKLTGQLAWHTKQEAMPGLEIKRGGRSYSPHTKDKNK